MKNTLKLVMLLGLVSAQVVTAQSPRRTTQPATPVVATEEQSVAGYVSNVGAKAKELGSKVYAWMKENPKKAIALGLTTVAALASVTCEKGTKTVVVTPAVEAKDAVKDENGNEACPAVVAKDAETKEVPTFFAMPKNFGIRPVVRTAAKEIVFQAWAAYNKIGHAVKGLFTSKKGA